MSSESNKWHHWRIRRSFIRRQTSGISSGNNRQRIVQWVTTSDNKWPRMTASGTTTTSGSASNKESKRMAARYNEWQRVAISANSFFSNKRGVYH